MEHASGPEKFLYVPSRHGTQFEPGSPTPVYPALHRQELCREDPGSDAENAVQPSHALMLTAASSGENVLAGHNEQAALPVAFLYFPVAHEVHGPPLSPV